MWRRTERPIKKKMGTFFNVVDFEERYGIISSPPKNRASGPLVSKDCLAIKPCMEKCEL